MYFKKTLGNGDMIVVDKNGVVISIMYRNKINISSLPEFDNYKNNIDFILIGIMITVHIMVYVLG